MPRPDPAADPAAEHADIRAGVARLCARFPDTCRHDPDARRACPAGFVTAPAEAGWLAAPIPEAHGGAGLPLTAACMTVEEFHALGCNAAACQAQMHTMGQLLRHATTEVCFDAPRIPADALIGEAGQGVRHIRSGMKAERILIAAHCPGDARWFRHRAAGHAPGAQRHRRPDRPPWGHRVPLHARRPSCLCPPGGA